MADFRYAQICGWLDRIGADVRGVLPAGEWQQYLPPGAPGRSILLFGAGGPAFVRQCQAYARDHGEPEHWLADYAQVLFEQWACGPAEAYLNPYRTGLAFPFQRAAEGAGIGVMGWNHVVLTPQWGPWFSLLGAVVLTDAPPPTRPSGWNPCDGCAAPCLKACPSGAVSLAGYDGQRCVATKLTHAPCLHACPARHACVVRSDLRAEMVALEAARRRDDQWTRDLLQSFLREEE